MKRTSLPTACVVFAVLVCAGEARAQFVPSSVPGVMVLPGYDAEILVDDPMLGGEAVELAIESDGNILASSNWRIPPSFDSPVFRYSPAGQLLATSNILFDPDGILAIPRGGMRDRILVAGGRVITEVNSMDGGTDVVFATG